MKLKRSEIEQIIKEELTRSRKQLVTEILGTTSKTEVQELLSIYFKESGGLPDDIYRLSVLFPVLEKAGLGDIVDAYIQHQKVGDEASAQKVLEPVRAVVQELMRTK